MTSALDLSSATQVMAGSSKTFFKAARFLPKATRHEIIRLYAFCRRIDDLADDPFSPLADRLEQLKGLASTLEDGSLTELRKIGWPFAASGTLARAAALLVRAAIGDLHQRQPQTEADLMAYAFGVAGTVGIMMAEVLGAEPEGYGAAVSLGMAMQLSNIARDVAEDFSQGRVYLPAASVAAHCLDGALRDGEIKDGFTVIEATRRVLVLADRLYEAAYDGIWSLPWRFRWGILAAAMCYRQIGIQVGKNIERSWQARTVVGNWRKGCLIAFAGVRVLLPRFWRRSHPARRPVELGDVPLRAMQQLGVAL